MQLFHTVCVCVCSVCVCVVCVCVVCVCVVCVCVVCVCVVCVCMCDEEAHMPHTLTTTPSHTIPQPLGFPPTYRVSLLPAQRSSPWPGPAEIGRTGSKALPAPGSPDHAPQLCTHAHMHVHMHACMHTHARTQGQERE